MGVLGCGKEKETEEVSKFICSHVFQDTPTSGNALIIRKHKSSAGASFFTSVEHLPRLLKVKHEPEATSQTDAPNEFDSYVLTDTNASESQ